MPEWEPSCRCTTGDDRTAAGIERAYRGPINLCLRIPWYSPTVIGDEPVSKTAGK